MFGSGMCESESRVRDEAKKRLLSLSHLIVMKDVGI